MRRTRILSLLSTTLLVSLASVLFATPASAATVCSYDEDTNVLRVEMTGDTLAVIDREDNRVEVNDVACFGGLLTSIATVTNTRRIVVQGDAGDQVVAAVLYNGLLRPGLGNEPGSSDEIEIVATLREGADTFRVSGTNVRDRIRIGADDPAVLLNLNARETTGVDADATVKGAEVLLIAGNMGNDTFDATGGAGTGSVMTAPVRLTGDLGNDTLTGGAGNDTIQDPAVTMIPDNDKDVARGGGGADSIRVDDFDTFDTAQGGAGNDSCTVDAGDVVQSC